MKSTGIPIIALEDVSFRYHEKQNWILKNVRFSIEPGEIICLVGANGSGKTTLGKLMVGELLPIAGAVRKNDNSKTCIRYQNYEKNLLPWYTAKHNLELCTPNSENHHSFSEWLKIANYEAWKNQTVHSLSGGQKQILSVVSTLFLEYEIVLLDEPFSAIDPSKIMKFWNLLREWSKARNVTLIVITHDLDEAIALGDKVFILSNPASGDIRSFAVKREARSDENFLVSSYAQELRQDIMDTFYGIEKRK